MNPFNTYTKHLFILLFLLAITLQTTTQEPSEVHYSPNIRTNSEAPSLPTEYTSTNHTSSMQIHHRSTTSATSPTPIILIIILLVISIICLFLNKKYQICLLMKRIIFNKTPQFANEYQDNSSTEKIRVKSEKENRRTMFVNLRLKQCIIVDKAKDLVPQMINPCCLICQYDF